MQVIVEMIEVSCVPQSNHGAESTPVFSVRCVSVLSYFSASQGLILFCIVLVIGLCCLMCDD